MGGWGVRGEGRGGGAVMLSLKGDPPSVFSRFIQRERERERERDL